MKNIRLASDLHLDFDIDNFNRSKRTLAPEVWEAGEMNFLWRPHAMPSDLESTFVIAGDLWTSGKFINRKYPDGQSWLEKVAQQFKYVVFVLGNHDFWGANITDEVKKIKKEIEHIPNLFLLEKDTVVLDDVKFVGATLWTDYGGHNTELMSTAPTLMNDYKKIRHGFSYGKLRPQHIYQIHMESRAYLFEQSVKDYDSQKLVVVSHMSPSEQSLPEYYRNNPSIDNFLYYTNLEKQIENSQIDYWFHGHTHANSKYTIGNTQVMANPRGYVNERDVNFDKDFLLEIDKKPKLKM